MKLVKVILTKRSNVIRVEMNDHGLYLATEYKNLGYPSEVIINQVFSAFSIDHALMLLESADKIKSKNWAKLPDWILI